MSKGVKYINAWKLQCCKYNPNSNQTLLLDFSKTVNDRYLILITRSVKLYVFLPSPLPSFNKCYKELL